MRKEEVELVPAGIITGIINNIEVRILSISPEMINVRLAEKINTVDDLIVCFYDFTSNKHEELNIKDYKIESCEEHRFYVNYILEINDNTYSNLVRKTVQSYYKYVMLKAYSEDNEFSKELVQYPAELDDEFYDYYLEQKKDWENHVKYKEFHIELAIKIDNDDLYKKYLFMNSEEFKIEYLRSNYLKHEGIFKNKLSRLYIGNEFCHNLFPDINMLVEMMNKAKKECLKITLCFTYLREQFICETKVVVDKVYQWARANNEKLEIVVNDYGMIKLMEGKEKYFSLNLGVVLNKRKKDPRYLYKKGYEENKELIADNSLNSKIFREFLKEYNIERYEYDTCGYKMNIAEGKHSLHIPFYVTNVSQYCTLYAKCTTGHRANQKLVNNCPKYCKEKLFLYPKHLNMIGRYNSLFAFDTVIFSNDEMLKYYIKSGIDRLVLNYL